MRARVDISIAETIMGYALRAMYFIWLSYRYGRDNYLTRQNGHDGSEFYRRAGSQKNDRIVWV
jgi:hypothetical protein